jgi:L-seryl-tRNA(Ser) seleniumtransferase
MQNEFRRLPAVNALLQQPEIVLLAALHGQGLVTESVRAVLAAARSQIAAGRNAPPEDGWPALVAAHLEAVQQPSLIPVINATGVIIHTNLGRAPLSRPALEAVAQTARGYSNLEYRLETGERGSRHDHVRARLCDLTGAEDALAVNNNAAAVYLILIALCKNREVLISRGQLVEIGGGFRIPDVLAESGARLVEVGTTNRTDGRDFAHALREETAAILRVHSSNFKQIGFTAMPELSELAAIAHADLHKPTLLIDDLGSGTLLDTASFGLAPEPMVQQSLTAGADLITFSGDKLLGGPQAGLIVGRRDLLEKLRRHPLARALRVDKLRLAALDATLRSYQARRATTEIPVWQMIAATEDELHARAVQCQARLAEAGVENALRRGESAVGGGSLPGETLPTWLLALPAPQPHALAARLRRGRPPIVCRIQQEHLLFDLRTLLPGEDETVVERISEALR